MFELERDKWGPLEYDDNPSFYEGLICDAIGIRDAHVYGPAALDKIMRVLGLDADWWRIAMERYLDPAQHRSRTAYDG